jgi:HAD superfamily hydrolase (TIGR01509 family)
MTEEAFFAIYSPNWLETYERAGLPREQWEAADEVWMAVALSEHAALFPGAAEALARLKARYRLGLVTSGSKERVMGDLDRTGLSPFFEVIVTGGDVTRPKPDPQGLRMALEAMGLAPEQALYIGDAQADCEMSARAGVRFVGVPSRFGSLKEGAGCTVLGGLEEVVAMLL